MATKPKRVILGVTGSIAAYKAADIIRQLQEKHFQVSVVMTEEANHFITPLTLATLSNDCVYTEMFDEKRTSVKVPHIDLAKQANILLIAPATANIIAKIACGIADDLLTCLAIAIKAPILIAPAMNDAMYENKIVQENCTRLKKFGCQFIDPAKGTLACGTIGKGRLAEIDKIVKEVERIVK